MSSLSMYQASVPVFIRGLQALSALLEKAVAHARANGAAPQALIDARLAPDMYNLAGQVQRASDASKLAVQRLSGVDAPRSEDTETTFDQLQERIANTIAYLRTVTFEQLEGSETRDVHLKFGNFAPSFSGDQYLLTFALPNFYFHVSTAYGILRHRGVNVGKLDFLGPYA